MTSTLPEVLATLDLLQVNQTLFRGVQLDGPAHHILGGHIGAQALVAAAHTVSADRPVRSMHAQFLRSGDARRHVDFEVIALHDGGTFSTRRATARQSGAILMEATVSFSAPAGDDVAYQPVIPVVPQPESLTSRPADGTWASLEWFERRSVVDPAEDTARIWWRPDGCPPPSPTLTTALVAYLSAVTPVEAALAARRGGQEVGPASMVDHSVWFHGVADLSDWLLYEQRSASGAQRRALTTGRMYNRNGSQVCTAAQEVYLPAPRPR
ncbi:MAG: acyl-CoA thioesterase domain-containing protein [Mycobacterium sp.]